MDLPEPETDKLPIRCPGCGQRFKVGQELRDRIVECGTCEHRFRVNEEVLLRTKKFYPGERQARTLDRFSRVPRTEAIPEASFQTVEYTNNPAAKRPIEPFSPVRLILGLASLVIAAVVAVMLVAGREPGGFLYGTPQSERLFLAVFSAVVCCVLMVAANSRNKARGALIGAALAAILLALPFAFPASSASNSRLVGDDDFSNSGDSEPEVSPELEDFKEAIGYGPVARMLEADPNGVGLLLRGLREYHRPQVHQYIVRSTGADASSHMYPRDGGYLMVLTGTGGDLDGVAGVCGRFGTVTRTETSLRVIVVDVRPESFEETAPDRFPDSSEPEFYALNLKEMESIDLDRALRAVSRLVAVEPKYFRLDIIKRLNELLPEGDVKLLGEIGKLLPTWSEPEDGSEPAALAALEKIPAGGEFPEPLVSFLAKRKYSDALPLLEKLWLLDPAKWEGDLVEFGPQLEDRLLEHLPAASMSQRLSAIRILGRVGSSKAIPTLERTSTGADAETKVLIARSIEAIQGR